MGNVNKTLSKDVGTTALDMGTLHPATARIYKRILDNFDLLTGDKAEEYGNPQTMCRRIGRRWFEREDGETDVAIMMAELKIERIKFDPTEAGMENPSACAMYLYEIKPISDKEPSQRLCDK